MKKRFVAFDVNIKSFGPRDLLKNSPSKENSPNYETVLGKLLTLIYWCLLKFLPRIYRFFLLPRVDLWPPTGGLPDSDEQELFPKSIRITQALGVKLKTLRSKPKAQTN